MGIEWQYKVELFDIDRHYLNLEERLNKLGEEGWNLVVVLPPNKFIFKRSKR